jgi:hypothetical protein
MLVTVPTRSWDYLLFLGSNLADYRWTRVVAAQVEKELNAVEESSHAGFIGRS